jgi:hypothetical protein
MQHKLITLLLLLAATTTGLAQDKMEIKDAGSNLLMQVNDEGAAGSITLPGLGSVPSVFTNKIYSLGGELYFNGEKLNTPWSQNGGNIFYNSGSAGIGTATPNSNAALDIDAAGNDKGVLLPRITTAQRTAISGLDAADEGLIVYDETTDSFWFWSGSQWNELGGGGGDNLGNHTATQTLDLNDNNILNGGTITADAFVGDGSGLTGINTADADADPTNELQTLSLDGDSLKLSNGNGVKLPSSSAGDNLGNHTATQNVNLNGNFLSGDGDDEGILVDDAGKVGIGASPSTAMLEVGGLDGVVFGGEFKQGAIPASGGGTRMMWYPGKGSFRAGHVQDAQWDDNNIGDFSMAFGLHNTASGPISSVSGGERNIASGSWATVGGGGTNTASGEAAIVSGGTFNTASGAMAAVSGGFQNTAAGDASVAGGRQAKIAAAHDGTFLFSDHRNFDFTSAAANEFAARATGGVRFVSGIDGSGNPNSGVKLSTGGNAWTDLNGNPIGGSLWNSNGANIFYNNGRVGIGTDTPAAPLHVSDNDGVLFGGAYGSGTLPASGAGTRMMWYPAKAAFRAGIVEEDQWDDTNIGNYSVALGQNNTASGFQSTVSGGSGNTASGQAAAVGGGALNTAGNTDATVSGGTLNTASGQDATVSGGQGNTASGLGATVAGGAGNTAAGQLSFAAGRRAKIDAAHSGAFLFSDNNNTNFNSAAANEFAARAIGGVRFVTGVDGSGNPTSGVKLSAGGNSWIDLNGNPIGGSLWSSNGANIFYNTGKVGIGTDTPDAQLHVDGTDGVLFGGTFNSGTLPASGAGVRMMWYPGKAAFRAGQVSGNQWDDANIGGRSTALGFDNIASGTYASVTGGDRNTASGEWSMIVGGSNNTASADFAAVYGGQSNIASASFAAVYGGQSNIASEFEAAVYGGEQNTASGFYATVLGGLQNSAAGLYSFAMGTRAKIAAAHKGAFLFSDFTLGNFNSAAANEFAARATGGVRFVTATDGSDNATAGVKLSAGGSSWTDLDGNPIGGSLWSSNGANIFYNNGKVGIGTDTPDAQLQVDGADGVVFGGTLNSGTLPASGPGVRMMWYPGKAAFRAGQVSGSQWDDANIGGRSIAMGFDNIASGTDATVMGGVSNTASGVQATVSGGVSNTASGTNATVTGGTNNTASGVYATVAGGGGNTAAGDNSFAAGSHANIASTHKGTFLFSDSNFPDFTSTAANEFAARSTGGVRFVTAVDGSGNPTAGVKVDAGGNTWTDLNGNPVGIGDNLGNHTATQTLDLNGNNIANANNVVVNGTVQIKGGSPLHGRVLTTDDLGNATWQDNNDPQILFTKTIPVQGYAGDDNWQNITSLTQAGNAASLFSKIYKMEGTISARLTGGNNIDDFEFRVEINCDGNFYYSQVFDFTPAQDNDNHNNFTIVPFLDYIDAPCIGGGITFRLQVRNTGDDPWEVKNCVLFVTGY